MAGISHSFQRALEQTLAAIASKRAAVDGRLLVGIAGPPGAGKSTLAQAVVDHLNGIETVSCALVPMDGFHLDNSVLEARSLLLRKGAPQTFDAEGFTVMITRLRKANQEVIVPVFDRNRDIAIAGCQVVDPDCPIVVVEGNYLLLNQAPWRTCHSHFDLTVFIAPPLATLEERLIARWRDYGLDTDAAKQRAMSNDIPNARLVFDGSIPADLMLD